MYMLNGHECWLQIWIRHRPMMSVHVASECSLILTGLATVTALVGDTLKVGLNVQAKCVLLRAWGCFSTKLTAPHFTHPLRHGLNSWLDILQIFDWTFKIWCWDFGLELGIVSMQINTSKSTNYNED